jgi:hypothetical protein
VKRSLLSIFAVVCATLAACAGTPPSSTVPTGAQSDVPAVRAQATIPNVIENPGFEMGFKGWTQCGTVAVMLTKAAHSGKAAALLGSAAAPEIHGIAAICQSVTVPSNGRLAFWIKQVAQTGNQLQHYYQEARLLGANGATLETFYKTQSSKGWKHHGYDVSAYAGQEVTLRFEVSGNGYAKGYVNQSLDDVSLTGTSTPPPTASPSPTPSPTVAPSVSPTVSPTPVVTSSPSPTPSPVSTTYPCNDAQFVTYQSEFAARSISADQFVDVCGSVTQVLASQRTSSGLHGYFYTSIAGSTPAEIEIVSNLDSMAEAPTNAPPAWPWVAVGDYAYVQGRYYYDDASSQGIDWTEDDTSGSWPHKGYVAVCSAVGVGCAFYQ